MADSDQGEKTEEPTAKKRQDALKEGQFARAPEIGVVFILGAAFIVLSFKAEEKAVEFAHLASSLFGRLSEWDLTLQGVSSLFNDGILGGLYVLSPMLFASVAGAIIAGGIQSGFRLTLEAIKVKFDKLSPVKGFKRIFSKHSFVQLGVDAMKFIVIGVIIYNALKQIMSDPIFYTTVPLNRLIEFILDSFLSLLLKLTGFIGIIALINYIYQKHKTTEDLKMTKQEVKDERKSSEGDPLVKTAQKRMAMQIMQKQMLEDVPTADVVVTNPTHYAVALKYEKGVDKAPMILAKGRNLFAQKIKEIAKEHGVPVNENKITARLLFRLGNVGQTIPVELYQVVAEILAYVYRTHRYYFHRLPARRKARNKA